MVSSKQLVEKIGTERVKYIASLEDTAKYLKRQVKKGDVVVVMGAGNITKLSDQLKSS